MRLLEPQPLLLVSSQRLVSEFQQRFSVDHCSSPLIRQVFCHLDPQGSLTFKLPDSRRHLSDTICVAILGSTSRAHLATRFFPIADRLHVNHRFNSNPGRYSSPHAFNSATRANASSSRSASRAVSISKFSFAPRSLDRAKSSRSISVLPRSPISAILNSMASRPTISADSR